MNIGAGVRVADAIRQHEARRCCVRIAGQVLTALVHGGNGIVGLDEAERRGRIGVRLRSGPDEPVRILVTDKALRHGLRGIVLGVVAQAERTRC